MRILAFQPWDDGSHKSVRQSIDRHSEHDWTWFSLPGREVRWRMRLGAACLMEEVSRSDALNGEIDAIFCTGLLDVAQLRALLPSRRRELPIILYMHENQLIYPTGPRMTEEEVARDGHLAATNISSLLAADRVIFNSDFNMRSCLEALPEFLSRSRTRHPVAEWTHQIRERSCICWPPVEPIPETVLRNTGIRDYRDMDLVAWPHRFEHDKGPDELLQIIESRRQNDGMRFSLFGQRYEKTPHELKVIRMDHSDRIECDRWFEDRESYLMNLARCGWVLSTARHEFFGMAVAEALMCGCLPWLPERLSYPELLPVEANRLLSPMNPPKDPDETRRMIMDHLKPALAPNAVSRLDQLLGPSP